MQGIMHRLLQSRYGKPMHINILVQI